jgi:hypothetical protein
MLGCLAWLLVASLQTESADRLPPWAYALSVEGAEAPRAEDEVPGVLQAEPAGGRGRDVSDFKLNVAAHLRYAIPFGAADRSYITYGNGLWVVNHYVSWSDFFHPGWGFDLELNIFLGKGANQQPGLNYGIAVILNSDEFGGDHVNDSLGRSLSLENLNMNSLLVGGKIIHSLGGAFYADGSFGIGAAHYTAVEGTFSGIGPSFRDEIFQDTWTFASQFRGHAGIRLGPVGVVAGLGFRIQAPPHEGARITMNSGAFWTFDLDLGVELGF